MSHSGNSSPDDLGSSIAWLPARPFFSLSFFAEDMSKSLPG
jgi:hypothetical protein